MRNVLMIHSVGSNHTSWKEYWLSVDKEQFELFCRYLCNNGYQTHFLDHWYNQENLQVKNKKDLYLTFDDGYLDNLLVAYPIMKKHGIKGTIFVNPEFVDPSTGIRSLESTNGQTLGYLNWDEICFLDKSGVMDIQSHSMSHNFYFCSDKMIDVHTPQNTYHWLAWYAKPENKYAWQYENQSQYTPYGTPVFEYYRALGLRRYFPDEKLIEKSIELYQSEVPKEEIIKTCAELLKQYPGRFESDEEKEKRFRYEIFDSKSILEEKLGKTVDYLCWPGGGYDEMSLRLAEEAGYKATTISSRDRSTVSNKENLHKRIVRMGMASTIRRGGYIKPQRITPTKFKRHLIWSLKVAERHPFYYYPTKLNNFILRFF